MSTSGRVRWDMAVCPPFSTWLHRDLGTLELQAVCVSATEAHALFSWVEIGLLAPIGILWGTASELTSELSLSREGMKLNWQKCNLGEMSQNSTLYQGDSKKTLPKRKKAFLVPSMIATAFPCGLFLFLASLEMRWEIREPLWTRYENSYHLPPLFKAHPTLSSEKCQWHFENSLPVAQRRGSSLSGSTSGAKYVTTDTVCWKSSWGPDPYEILQWASLRGDLV